MVSRREKLNGNRLTTEPKRMVRGGAARGPARGRGSAPIRMDRGYKGARRTPVKSPPPTGDRTGCTAQKIGEDCSGNCGGSACTCGSCCYFFDGVNYSWPLCENYADTSCNSYGSEYNWGVCHPDDCTALGCAPTDIEGCTDSAACNYDPDATDDDDSCWFANAGCECSDGEGAVVDCAGVCGGVAFINNCGDCLYNDCNYCDISDCPTPHCPNDGNACYHYGCTTCTYYIPQPPDPPGGGIPRINIGDKQTKRGGGRLQNGGTTNNRQCKAGTTLAADGTCIPG
jgi:hypothetical protein